MDTFVVRWRCRALEELISQLYMQIVLEPSGKAECSRSVSVALQACSWLQAVCPERWQPTMDCAVAVAIHFMAGAAAAARL